MSADTIESLTPAEARALAADLLDAARMIDGEDA